MQFGRYATEAGFPGIWWDQEVPTGETEFSRQQEVRWKFSLLTGLAVFGGMLGAGRGFGQAFWVGAAVGWVLFAADGIRQLKFNVQGGTVGGIEKSQAEHEAERRSKLVRVYRRERRWAEVRFEPASKMLLFVVMQDAPDGVQVRYEVPLSSFAELELSTDQEWFGDIGARELAQHLQAGSSWVIVAQAAEHGVLLIARSGRDKAGMAHLHQVLRSEFIAKRTALWAKAEEMASGS